MTKGSRVDEVRQADDRVAHLAGVILCGGRSSRMGRPKAWLPFGDELLLERVARIVGGVAAPLVVVAAPDQELPPLPPAIAIVRDPVEGRGPLQGIAVGLSALADRARYAFVSATDAPLLCPAFVRRLAVLAEGRDAAVVRAGGHLHPLGAVYATHLHPLARRLLAAGQRSACALVERADTRLVDKEELLADEGLRRADPALASLSNLNTPEDYAASLAALRMKGS